jgi:hypothetical protein
MQTVYPYPLIKKPDSHLNPAHSAQKRPSAGPSCCPLVALLFLLYIPATGPSTPRLPGVLCNHGGFSMVHGGAWGCWPLALC